MIGKTVSNFKIVEKLGEGGMGVVYRATDARLKRPVALKFLPQHYTSSPDAVERFEREAQSAAALNHPNIITIYEIGEYEGQIYIAMEYVEGVELRELITPGLALPRALEIAIQMADGLHGAHDAGIVHRDIKPENILVTDKGRVKILDFGLAKLHGMTRITQESSTVGTLHYMSPEQTRGEDVDHRSDIFSFGAVLYEMLTGAAAFPGDNSAAVTHAIAQTTPHPVKRFNRDASDELERIVMKCLEKNREERYQSIKEVLVDLRKVAGISAVATPMPGTTQQHPVARAASTGGMFGWRRLTIPVVVVAAAVAVWMLRGGGPETAKEPVAESSRTMATSDSPAESTESGKTMIAVLPFQNLGEAGDEYFADGMTEEITSRLATVRDLGVISRTSAMQYKDSKKSLREIGEELGVDYVLEGTVRWSKSGGADRVRITPQLITVSDDTHLWSDRYDRTLEDIFEVQSEIAQSIVRELDVSLVEGEQEDIEERPTDNMQAYQFYLRGVDMWAASEFERDQLEATIEVFNDAVRLDPEFAAALRHLAVAHSAMAHWGYDRSEERMALAKGYAERALEVDPESFNGHLALGTYYYWCRKDYESALRELDRAEELRPNQHKVIEMRAYVKRRMGLYRETIADLERVQQLDPRDNLIVLEAGDTYMVLREFDMAERCFRRALELAPSNVLGYWYPVILELARGDLDATHRNLGSMPAGDDQTLRTLAWVAFFDRDVGAVRDYASRCKEPTLSAPTFYTPPEGLVARLYHVLGKPAEARAEFEKARDHLRADLAERPRDARIYAELCVVEAGLGNRAASNDARKRCIAVAEPDVYGSPAYDAKFFEAAALLGDTDDALDRLDALLSKPSEFYHPGWFRILPTCDPLRDDPRFEQILAKHENETF
jgi:serine/threonine protein kinase/tetratricopeptide (TPR) repeat protein